MKQILVIHNDTFLQQSLGELFAFHGFKILQASTISEALRFYKEFSPDVVICDHFLPRTNGFDILKQLRQAHPNVMAPFIFMVDHPKSIDEFKTRLNQSYILIKPFEVEEILTTIRQAIKANSSAADANVSGQFWPNESLGTSFFERNEIA